MSLGKDSIQKRVAKAAENAKKAPAKKAPAKKAAPKKAVAQLAIDGGEKVLNEPFPPWPQFNPDTDPDPC